ncbi:MAG: hypothetical protein KIS74_00150 [Burkholderiales bacterium]|nr:hypothetical protein [Burkholderiales bacterium]
MALHRRGIPMMRGSGFEVPVDEGTKEKFAEMRILESSTWQTGLLAMQPLLHMRHEDLWQLRMPEK